MHKEWEFLATIPYDDSRVWGEHLSTVRFSFGVMHQVASAVFVMTMLWLMLTLSECARQMPPVKWK